MSRYFSYPPYVPVAERRRKAEAAANKLAKKSGRALAPVSLASKKIATTFWGKSWCDNLEAYSDFENRLPRGRSYIRNGSVIDLQITRGQVEALVQGSKLYKIAIGFSPLAPKRWTDFKARSAGQVTNLLDLLQGRLSKEILADLTAQGAGLFPAPSEIKLDCSCPDWADMCKHVAAVLYGVGARLDEKPELFFTLRGVDMEELITAASASVTAPLVTTAAADSALAGADLADIFGVEIEAAPPAPGGITSQISAKPAPPQGRKRATAKKPEPATKSKPLRPAAGKAAIKEKRKAAAPKAKQK